MSGEPTTYRDALGRLFVNGRLARPAEQAGVVPSPSVLPDVEEDYGSMSRPELMRLAKAAGHRVTNRSTRDDLIGLLIGGA